MIERFKRYLEREFRAIAPTKAAYELREDTLTKLLDLAQEFRIKGMTDEDMIYDLCIDSLGDFRTTLIAFEEKGKENVVKARKFSNAAIVAMSSVALLVIVYLVLSFALPNAWGKTWMILVGAAFSAVIVGLVAAGGKSLKNKKYSVAKFSTAGIIALLFVFAFLCCQILFNVDKAWTLFPMMVIVILAANAVIALLYKTKIWLLEMVAFIQVFFSLGYVLLGLFTGSWSPAWLLNLFGVFVNLVLVAAVIVSKNKAKEKAAAAEENERLNVQNEEFYTTWKDR